MLARRTAERGDTIIEVLLAITVFSLVAVAAIAIMNQGVNTTQRALEITLVRQQMDSQIEALRAAHQAYPALDVASRATSKWKTVTTKVGESPDDEPVVGEGACPSVGQLSGGAFAFNPLTGQLLDTAHLKSITDTNAPPYAQFSGGNVYGIWVKGKLKKSNNTVFPDAYDFRVRACWQAAGMTSATPMWIETDVRLYDVVT